MSDESSSGGDNAPQTGKLPAPDPALSKPEQRGLTPTETKIVQPSQG